jgi:hypothetical protein
MTPEQQRIAIAEACGWTKCVIGIGGLTSGIPPAGSGVVNCIGGDRCPVPNYTQDLNAMHEAENILKTWQKRTYGERITSDFPDGMRNQIWALIHASAAQRAEAFLRTIGKW